jgi:hypothetical protein
MPRLFSFVVFFSLGIHICFSQSVVINEILSSNSTINEDENGDFEDWIELFNAGNVPVNLSGYGLSDDTNQLFKFVLPEITLLPQSFLLVWASDKDRNNPQNPIHTNFRIGSEGEALYLTSPNPVQIHRFPPISLGSNFSFGRQPDGSDNLVYFTQPTPSTSNVSTGYSRILQAPGFSRNSGFYIQPFDLHIQSQNGNDQIIYTLDGSEPDPNNLNGRTYRYKTRYPGGAFFIGDTIKSLVYSQPIPIVDRTPTPNRISKIATSPDTFAFYIPTSPVLKATVVKAMAVSANALPSPVVAATFFVRPDSVNLFQLPVVSLSADEDKLFDYDTGIYVPGREFDIWRVQNPTAPMGGAVPGNFRRSSDAWEIPANYTYFVSGQEQLNQKIGIRIAGQATRAYPSKSLRLVARNSYGKGSFGFRKFGHLPDTSFSRLTLRNSGQDRHLTYFRDALVHTLCKELHFDKMAYQPTVTFLNGEYWGLLNLREQHDRFFIERNYGVKQEELDMVENNFNAEEGDTIHYNQTLLFAINQNLGDSSNFERIKSRIDLENFTDYFVANIFINNTDWPHANIRCWRKRTNSYQPNAPKGHDGRWRWMMHDTDFGLGYSGNAFSNTIQHATRSTGPLAYSTLLFRQLLTNQAYKNQFINRFADLMNTSFLPGRIEQMITEFQQIIAPEIPRHTARWLEPSGTVAWNIYVNIVRTFVHQRRSQQEMHIRQYFGLDTLHKITLAVNDTTQGFIRINSIDIKQGTPGVAPAFSPWSGRYFSNVPIRIEASLWKVSDLHIGQVASTQPSKCSL